MRVLDDPVDRGDHLATSVPPSAAPTLTLTMRASGAMPAVRGGRCVGVRRGERASWPAIRPAMNVPCPLVSRLREVRRLRLERQVGSVDDLVGAVEPVDGRRRRYRSARRRRPCRCSRRSTMPSRRCTRSCCTSSSRRSRGRSRRRATRPARAPRPGEGRSGSRRCDRTPEVEAPATVGPSARRTGCAALRTIHLQHRYHLRYVPMCGAWQPGGLWEAVSRKIPGFASPPFDGFAEFADRTLRRPIWPPRLMSTIVGWPGRGPMGRKSRSLPGGTGFDGAPVDGQPASTTRSGAPLPAPGRNPARRSGRPPWASSDSIEDGSSGRAK